VELHTPDFCASLDRLKSLCDELEHAQDDQDRYLELVELIRVEADVLSEMACHVQKRGN
jgi:hypothetical protein